MEKATPLVESHLIRQIGHGLTRPECVKIKQDGSVWVCDLRGFVQLHADGSGSLLAAKLDAPQLGTDESQEFTPNGFSFLPDGRIAFANYGEQRFETLDADGNRELLLEEVDGLRCARPNYVAVDANGGLWMTVSTRTYHWEEKAAQSAASIRDGFVIRLDAKGARVVANDLLFANECKVSPDGRYLFVAETLGARVLRYEILPNGDLGPSEQFGPTFSSIVDGVTFDPDGNLWVTEPIAERIWFVTPAGDARLVAACTMAEPFAAFMEAKRAGKFDLALAFTCSSEQLGFVTSVSFGGVGGHTVYAGNLRGGTIATFARPSQHIIGGDRYAASARA